MSNIDRFSTVLYSEWLPSFCNARPKDFKCEGFVGETITRLSDFDAYWFLRAFDKRLVVENKGFFKAPKTSAKEQIFWSGKRGEVPRKLFLWAEPIITVGACARLVEKFNWPIEQIGTQSKYPWPFDLVCYDPSINSEIIVCEVKKSLKEIEILDRHIRYYGALPALKSEPLNAAERNAYRKVVGIRKSVAQIYWSLGPNGSDTVFKIERENGSEVFQLEQVTVEALDYTSFS